MPKLHRLTDDYFIRIDKVREVYINEEAERVIIDFCGGEYSEYRGEVARPIIPPLRRLLRQEAQTAG